MTEIYVYRTTCPCGASLEIPEGTVEGKCEKCGREYCCTISPTASTIEWKK